MNRGTKIALAAIAAGALVSLGAMRLSRAEPAEIFNKKCASCHGKDGKGKTKQGEKLKIKPLSDGKATDAEAEQQIADGAKDKETGKERMPAFKGKLTPAEIKDLVKYGRTLK
jgi:mono/diheme cytochrome c family protein